MKLLFYRMVFVVVLILLFAVGALLGGMLADLAAEKLFGRPDQSCKQVTEEKI